MSGSVWPVTCAQCGTVSYKPVGAVNRSQAKGAPLYCNRECAGIGRRKNRTANEKKHLKAEYDRKRRAELGDALLAEKRAAYHAKVAVDPVSARAKEREARQRRMPKHVEYCRRPEYRKWKAQYDRQYLARKQFGDFGEAAIVLNDLCSEIASRSTFTERAILKGTLNKHTQRRREYERQTDRR